MFGIFWLRFTVNNCLLVKSWKSFFWFMQIIPRTQVVVLVLTHSLLFLFYHLCKEQFFQFDSFSLYLQSICTLLSDGLEQPARQGKVETMILTSNFGRN